jgi:drug/metabolite transporter (DMT)-like permease
MVYVLAVAAAFSNALTSILQRMGVEDAPDDATLRLRLLTHAIRRGVWLLGFAVLIASFLLQAVALHLGNMSQVQPILTTELLFLVLILATWFRFRIGWHEWLGAAAAAGGLAGFLYFAQPGGGTNVPTASNWIVTGAICAGAVAFTVALALRGPRWWRAAMFGAAGAIGFAFTASLIKSVGNVVASDWTQIFSNWQTYAMAACGIFSLFLAQNAFHAGPIAASQTALVLVDPLASIAIGIALFNDNLRTTGAYGPLEAVSLLVMFAGAAWLAQSPLISGMKGGDERYEELLSTRSRSARLAQHVVETVPEEAREQVREQIPQDVRDQISSGLTHS